jgi:prophage tail gpP-like protein
VTTDSWRDSSGELWSPNRLVTLNLPTLKIVDRVWLIAEVTFLMSESGATCELTIMPPEGFMPEPINLNPFDPDLNKAAS